LIAVLLRVLVLLVFIYVLGQVAETLFGIPIPF